MPFIQTPSFKLAYYAKGDPNANKIALVLPGRLDTKDYVHMRSHVDFLSHEGFYALSFDPPGTWDSPGIVEDYTTTTYLKAVNELIKYFGNKPTLLVGHSRGGTLSILAGAINDCVIGIVPIMATYGSPTSPMPDEIRTGMLVSYRDLPPGNRKAKEKKKFILSANYFIDGRSYNAAEELKNITKPKLIIFGTQDEFTSPEKVREVYKTLSEPKMIVELDSDHDYRYHPDMIKKVNEALGDFIKKYQLG